METRISRGKVLRNRRRCVHGGEGGVPQRWKDATIEVLHNVKYRTEGGSYSSGGISQVVHADKVLALGRREPPQRLLRTGSCPAGGTAVRRSTAKLDGRYDVRGIHDACSSWADKTPHYYYCTRASLASQKHTAPSTEPSSCGLLF